MTLRIHIMLEPKVLADPAVEAALPNLVDGISGIHGEDIAVNEGRGGGCTPPLASQGRLSPNEAAIWQFDQLWLSRVE